MTLSLRLLSSEFLLLLSMVGLGCPALAQSYALPLGGQKQQLVVQNQSAQEESLWISSPISGPEGVIEEEFVIPPQSEKQISWAMPLGQKANSSWLRVETRSPKLSVLALLSLFSQISTSTKISTLWRAEASSGKIWIANLSSQDQSFDLELVDGVRNLKISAFASLDISVPQNQSFLIRSQFNLAVLVKNQQNWAPAQALNHPIFPGGRFPRFVLADDFNQESFVIEISDPKLAEQARIQIQTPQAHLPRMLIARVGAGHGDLNQNLSSEFQSPWSWHVTEISRFADFGSIDCDGRPSLLEKTLNWWLDTRGGMICFWNFKVVRELP